MIARYACLLAWLGFSACSSDGGDGADGPVDAQVATVDACTLVVAPALYGTLEDSQGNAIEPTLLEMSTDGERYPCSTFVREGRQSYTCSEPPPRPAGTDLYGLHLEFDGQSREWEFELARGNCHVRGMRFNIIIPVSTL